jgi:hypothetical protein
MKHLSALNVPKLLVWLDGAVIGIMLFLFIRLIVDSAGATDGGLVIVAAFPVVLAVVGAAAVDALIVKRLSREHTRPRLVTYFVLTRVTLLGLVGMHFYSFIMLESVGSTSPIYYPIFMIILILGIWLCGLALYQAAGGKRQIMLLGAVCLLAFVLVGYLMLSVMGTGRKESGGLLGTFAGRRRDNQIAHDVQLLAQDIESFAFEKQRFPNDLQEAIALPLSYGADEHVDDRLDWYHYEANGKTGDYKLCATFATDTRGSSNAAEGFTKAEAHDKGYQCFDFKIYNWSVEQESLEDTLQDLVE